MALLVLWGEPCDTELVPLVLVTCGFHLPSVICVNVQPNVTSIDDCNSDSVLVF